MLIKKAMTVLLASNFALGAISCGVKKAEENTLATMAALEQRIEEHNSEWDVTTSKSGRYVKDALGVFSLTFYVPDTKWGYQTSTGVRSQHLRTCAVDPNVIPLGSVIRITGDNGQTLTLKCVDIGGGIKGSKIDIFWDGSVSSGYDWIADFGTVHSVWLLEE